MELSDVIRGRRMLRTFDPQRQVPEHILERALDAATRAPSAGFSQGWDFVVLAAADDRSRFWEAATPAASSSAPDRWLRGVSAAPCLVVCCSDPQRYRRRYAEPDKAHKATATPGDVGEDDDGEDGAWPIPYWDVDTGMAALLMLLTGVDEGLGGLFFGVPAPSMDQVRSALDIPSDRRLVGVVALGYPLADARSPSLQRGRRPLSEVAHAGRFGVPFRTPTTISTGPNATQAHNTAIGIPDAAPSE